MGGVGSPDNHISDELAVQPSDLLHADALSESERAKLRWLLGVIRGVQDAYAAAKADRLTAMYYGVDFTSAFDWSSVRNRCYPEVLLFMAKAKSDGAYDAPLYAIIPRLGMRVELHDGSEFGKSQPEQKGSVGLAPLEAIQAVIDSMPMGKKVNAEKQFTVLKRIIGSALLFSRQVILICQY
jgi:hypothetical protein